MQCRREGCCEAVNKNVIGGTDYCSGSCYHLAELQRVLLRRIKERRHDTERHALLRAAWVASAELAGALDEVRELAVQRRERGARPPAVRE